MKNSEISAVFLRIAALLEIKGENVFKINAYRRAAENIGGLGRELADVRAEGGIEEIEGVGKAISEKISELLDTGALQFLKDLEEEVPPSLLELLDVPDLGAKRVRGLWGKLGVTDLEMLERVLVEGKVRELAGFGPKSEEKILAGLVSLKNRRLSKRVLLGMALPLAEMLLHGLKDLPGVERAAVAGSTRRRKETVGDLDILVASFHSEEPMDFLADHILVSSVILRGPTKMSVRLESGLQLDLRVIPPERWGTALQYFTGSQQHNVQLRELALSKGYSLSEYALKKVGTDEEVLCADEADVYRNLGLKWVPPELREGRGEIEQAANGTLPFLVEERDLKGDLQSHTTWSDGSASVLEMATRARECGRDYLLITDHSHGLGIAGGISAEELEEQAMEIGEAQREMGADFRILRGVELEIRADGSLDLPDGVLASLDLVVAAGHSSLRQERSRITERYLHAIRHPHVHVLAHPMGRLLGERDPVDADWDLVFREAARTGTFLELNAQPQRLDLSDVLARRALELGCLLVISTDAHSPDNLELMRYGLATARRAGATKEQVATTWPVEKLLDFARRKPERL